MPIYEQSAVRLCWSPSAKHPHVHILELTLSTKNLHISKGTALKRAHLHRVSCGILGSPSGVYFEKTIWLEGPTIPITHVCHLVCSTLQPNLVSNHSRKFWPRNLLSVNLNEAMLGKKRTSRLKLLKMTHKLSHFATINSSGTKTLWKVKGNIRCACNSNAWAS